MKIQRFRANLLTRAIAISNTLFLSLPVRIISPVSGMNLQQIRQPESSTNEYGSQEVERETVSKLEQKLESGNTKPSRLTTQDYGSPSRERLVYLTRRLIGHTVEVQVSNGSLFSGIFHSTIAEEDFGIVLKMARLIGTGSSQEHNSIADSISKVRARTLIIPAEELVQITAKGVSVTKDGLSVTKDGFANDSCHSPDEDDHQ
ncbi:polyadenylate-binding protein-interacting protein 4-like isoform X2 [Actinidia eriantha]|uniref:polyadenylate-binding protein-interacting protein 4-like isoform X2 n=2 Tax=Actinidia eriantha TaxID=165200 RepID=UPI002589035D|nr:polyadenylate-binding protein-interacting protein 4-like isoform X2 [Actinidia eriantha]